MPDTRTDVRLHDIAWRPIIRTMVGVALLLLALLVVRELANLLQALLVAVFLAIAADAVARIVQRTGLSRRGSLLVVIVGGAVAGLLVLALLVPPLLTQGTELVNKSPAITADIQGSDTWEWLESKFDINDSVITTIKNVMVEIPSLMVGLASDLIGGIFELATVLLAVSFLLAGGGQVVALVLRLAPPLASTGGWRVVIGAYNNIGRYIIGASFQALCAGVALALVLFVLGVPYALALGMFMLIMDYIPLVGATIGAIPAVAVALFTSGFGTGIVVLVFLIVYQQVENSIIQPRIQGKVVNLPGITIFFSVMIGSELLGVLGALIAVPVASIISIMLTQYFDYTGRAPVRIPHIFDDRGRMLEVIEDHPADST